MKRWTVIFSLMIILAGCAGKQVCDRTVSVAVYDEAGLRNGMNRFAGDMFAELAKKPETNVFYSPFSISSAVSLLYTGAKNETAREISDVMHYGGMDETFSRRMGEIVTFHSSPEDQVECRSSQSLWVQKGYNLKPAYEQAMVVDFKSVLQSVDFARKPLSAKTQIDSWVAKITRNRIKEIIPEDGIDADTRLILVNAIYFEGKWNYPFNEKNTLEKPFYVSEDEVDTCDLMYQRRHFRYSRSHGCQIVELPYEGKGYSMLLVVPEKRFGIRDLDPAAVTDMIKKHDADLAWEDVELFLPRFEFKTMYQLKDAFINMGMKKVFSTSADLSGIGEGNLFVSYIIHKAYIKVDEVKTEAAAATAIGVRVTSMAPVQKAPKIVRADHPFMFAIRENGSGQILFLGRMSRAD